MPYAIILDAKSDNEASRRGYYSDALSKCFIIATRSKSPLKVPRMPPSFLLAHALLVIYLRLLTASLSGE